MGPSGAVGPARLPRPAGANRLAPPGGWWPLVSAALLVGVGALSRTGWVLAREASLRQQCSFVATLLAVGVRLWFPPFGR